jgi:hypothetical protein
MSYAYLFKYIIIGDTGFLLLLLLLLLSSRVYVRMCVRVRDFFFGTRVFLNVVCFVVLSQLQFVFQSGHGRAGTFFPFWNVY